MLVTPARRPVTTPEDEPIVATVGVPLNHVPPPASVNVVDKPTQTSNVPLMAAGNGLTVTSAVV